jgi:hypothetical protein
MQQQKFLFIFGQNWIFFEITDRNFRTRMPITIIHFYARDNNDSTCVLVCIPPQLPSSHCKLALLGVKIATTKMSFAFKQEKIFFIQSPSKFGEKKKIAEEYRHNIVCYRRSQKTLTPTANCFPSSCKFSFQSADVFPDSIKWKAFVIQEYNEFSTWFHRSKCFSIDSDPLQTLTTRNSIINAKC